MNRNYQSQLLHCSTSSNGTSLDWHAMAPGPTTYAVKTADQWTSSHTDLLQRSNSTLTLTASADQGLFRGNHSSKRVNQQRSFRRHGSKIAKMKIFKGKVLLGPKAIRVDHFLNHSLTWASIVCLLTIWALYADDVKGIYIAKEYDRLFATINWLIFIVFMFEWLADSVVHLDYFGSLTSMMDLLAALSLVPMGEVLQDQTSVARVARTFRALRILRATRAAAMALKTEASMKRARTARKIAKDIEKGIAANESTHNQSKSLLEATLLERGNVKMLLGVLVLLMGMSLIDYTESDRSAEGSLNMIDNMVSNNHHNNHTLSRENKISMAIQYQRNIEFTDENATTYRRLLYLNVQEEIWVPALTSNTSSSTTGLELLEQRRQSEVFKLSTTFCTSYIDLKPYYDVMNINSMISTTFSIVVIMIWASSFRNDYTSLVLIPVTRMVKVLRELTKNPRLAIAKGKMSIVEDLDNEVQKSEMEVIEACIGKFGMLLKVGFGEGKNAGVFDCSCCRRRRCGWFKCIILHFQMFFFDAFLPFHPVFNMSAGMNIIAKNMSGSVFDPVIKGTKVFAIFGFCDIRNFTDCCEILEEETMIFTNCIASVVHSRVHSSGGVVNKNIGDAFLAVWKVKQILPHDISVAKPLRRGSMFAAVAPGNANSASRQLSHNLTTKSNMFVEMESSSSNRGEIDSKYATNAQQNPSRIANCIVPEDLSLVGQESKEMTHERYVHFLTNSFSVVDEALWSFLKIRQALTSDPKIQEVAGNPKLQKKLPGYTVRMGYGLHLGWGIEGAIGSSHKVDASYLSPHVNMSARLEAASKQFNVQLLLSDAFVKQLYSSQLKANCRPLDVVTVKGSLQPLTLYTYQPDEYPSAMTVEQRTEFTVNWLDAFDSYVEGNWKDTRTAIAKCLIVHPEDGPCQTMLRTIKQNEAPDDWKGYRALTSK